MEKIDKFRKNFKDTLFKIASINMHLVFKGLFVIKLEGDLNSLVLIS
jgi:hypothetical protein